MGYNILDDFPSLRQEKSAHSIYWKTVSRELRKRRGIWLVFSTIIGLILMCYSSTELSWSIPNTLELVTILSTMGILLLTTPLLVDKCIGFLPFQFIGGMFFVCYPLLHSKEWIPYLTSLSIPMHLSYFMICVLPIWIFYTLSILIIMYYNHHKTKHRETLEQD